MVESVKKCIAYIDYEDGSYEEKKCNLKGDMPFGLEEMEKWLKYSSKKSIKRIVCEGVKNEVN